MAISTLITATRLSLLFGNLYPYELAVPGRGLDTAFTRRYQSQAVYSGCASPKVDL